MVGIKVFLLFCFMIDRSGSESVPRTTGSGAQITNGSYGSGSGLATLKNSSPTEIKFVKSNLM
jgi:hypothetical protein